MLARDAFATLVPASLQQVLHLAYTPQQSNTPHNSDFEAKNPVVSQFDRFESAQKDPRTVAALFAAKQIEHLREDKTEEQAYALASAWLLEHGREVLMRMGVLMDGGTAQQLALDAFEKEQLRQTQAMRAALRSGLHARQRYRSFATADDRRRVTDRAASSEPVLLRLGHRSVARGGDAAVPARPDSDGLVSSVLGRRATNAGSVAIRGARVAAAPGSVAGSAPKNSRRA